MVESLPFAVWEVPFIDIGGRAEGAAPSDAYINQREMIVGSVIVLPSHGISAPYTHRFEELNAVPGFPTGDYLLGQAPRVQQSLKYKGQDTSGRDPFSYLSLIHGDLSAPPLQTGNSNFWGNC